MGNSDIHDTTTGASFETRTDHPMHSFFCAGASISPPEHISCSELILSFSILQFHSHFLGGKIQGAGLRASLVHGSNKAVKVGVSNHLVKKKLAKGRHETKNKVY